MDDTRPAGARPNYTDTSGVEKYEMPEDEYSKLSDSVLSWKKRNQLGRFDPTRPTTTTAATATNTVDISHITIGSRCRVGGADVDRRGEVAYIGDVAQIQNGQGGIWVGVRLDEPTGKNDGSLEGQRYFTAKQNCGAFIRPDRLQVGDFPVKELDEEDFMEEL